mmetsp:Transcript_3845/g.24363  ORF Transcript_3845/g.24363 Transcript_3845/m.24363 type:complete len:116 (-) Transcript_3845:70-417(-)
MASLILHYTPVPSLLNGSFCCWLTPQTTSFLLFVVIRQGCIQCNELAFPLATFQPSVEHPFDREMKDPIFLTPIVNRLCDFPPESNNSKTFVIRTASSFASKLVVAQDGSSIDQG